MLKEIEKIVEKYGSSFRNPVSDTEIIKMKQHIQLKFGNIALPESTVDLWERWYNK
ncbi:hypothetical protein [Metabacillus hrfriensis]|uniref:Uncharacterized protein n=1 Tax=Metabacillus hrfriensis TaxID=3048891 RepID=A0ACD4RDS4_9BACI|nr:hypothetical protein [Metabacillus sp. CT-WN-B3]UOK58398.1 hypothetical protein MGI18_03625 [Bacillus sp. OVS6]USK29074.1 hypothetical protein LIT32_02665 [Bacillus sp. CMF21]WHZ58292.1 hypothetical protein QLQ22_02645 [Metabacillus sp. CT-WN-B3]